MSSSINMASKTWPFSPKSKAISPKISESSKAIWNLFNDSKPELSKDKKKITSNKMFSGSTKKYSKSKTKSTGKSKLSPTKDPSSVSRFFSVPQWTQQKMFDFQNSQIPKG
jgi:hypothetical protein